MLVKLAPSTAQIRYHTEAALNAFETLDVETAVEVAQSELRGIARYLDALDNTDDAVAVYVSGGVKPKIVLEGIIGSAESGD